MTPLKLSTATLLATLFVLAACDRRDIPQPKVTPAAVAATPAS